MPDQEYIRLHVILNIGAEMRTYHELFKRSVRIFVHTRALASQYISSSFSSRVTQKFLRGSNWILGNTQFVSPADRNMYAVLVGIARVPSCLFTSMTSLLPLSSCSYPANTSRHPARSL